MIRWLLTLMMLSALALAGLPGSAPASAQTGGVTIYLQPVDADTGESITDACFVLQNFSNEGCDANGDGVISYEGIPAGDYIVVQTQEAAGYPRIMPQ